MLRQMCERSCDPLLSPWIDLAFINQPFPFQPPIQSISATSGGAILPANYSIAALIRAQESFSTAELSDDKPSGVTRTPSAKSSADIYNRSLKDS